MKNRTAKRLRGWTPETMPEVRSCRGKIRYPDAGEARSALNDLRRQRKGSKTMTSYQCGHCGAWHVGHSFFDPDSSKNRRD